MFTSIYVRIHAQANVSTCTSIRPSYPHTPRRFLVYDFPTFGFIQPLPRLQFFGFGHLPDFTLQAFALRRNHLLNIHSRYRGPWYGDITSAYVKCLYMYTLPQCSEWHWTLLVLRPPALAMNVVVRTGTMRRWESTPSGGYNVHVYEAYCTCRISCTCSN